MSHELIRAEPAEQIGARVPPSAHDVARLAGVSQSAVSRAFTTGASISSATKTRVMEAAERLGYRPNPFARSLITGQSRMIGVIIGDYQYPFFVEVFNQLSERLSKIGKHILTCTADAVAIADEHAERLSTYRIDGLVLIATKLSSKLQRHYRKKGIPIVSFVGPARANGQVSITGEERKGAAAIAAHLLAGGYRRPAVMIGKPSSPSSRNREEGFSRHLTHQGLSEPERVCGLYEREPARDAARTLLGRTERPDAVFCANDDMAIAVMEVARHEYGLRIGRELGVAGFDDIALASWPSFDLTTYAIPVEGMIDEVIAALSETPGDHPAHRIVPGELKARGSTLRG